MSRALAGQTISYTSSMLLTRGVAVVWLIVLPRFLSAAEYGVFGLISTAAALINLLVPLEVTQGLARYYPTAEVQDARKYSGSAWSFTLLMLCVTALVFLIFSRNLCNALLGDERYLFVSKLAVAFFVLNTLLYFLQNQFRWDFRSREFLIGSVLFAFTTLVCSLAGAFLPDPLSGIVLGQISGVAVGVGYGAVRLRYAIKLGIDPQHLKRMLRFSLPLVVSSLAVYLSTYVSRFFIQHSLGLQEVGLFIWASQVASLPPLLLLGVQASLTPYIMKHFGESGTPRIVARIFEGVVCLELTICLALGLALPEFIDLAGYRNYSSAAPLVLILAPAQLLLQLYVFAPGFAIGKRTDLQLLVSLVGAITAVCLNYLFDARFGSAGAASAMLVASVIFLGCWFTLSNKLYRIPVRWARLAIVIATFGACSALGSTGLLSHALWGHILRIGLVVLTAAMIFLVKIASVEDVRLWIRQLRGIGKLG